MKKLICMLTAACFMLSVIYLAQAGRDNDWDGSLSAHVSTRMGKDNKPRAYANVSGGYRKWEQGNWYLTAYVPNPQTEGLPFRAGMVSFNSTIYETLYHRGSFGDKLKDCYANAYCNAKLMRGGWHHVYASC